MRNTCLRIGEPDKPLANPDLSFISYNLISNKSIYESKIHQVPELDYFNIKPECDEQKNVCIFEGGETKALELFKQRLDCEIESFKQAQMNPNWSRPLIASNLLSLSAYLRFGCLSVRKFYWDVTKAYLKVNFLYFYKNYFNSYLKIFFILYKKYYTGPDKTEKCPVEQLFWREYFYQLSYSN